MDVKQQSLSLTEKKKDGELGGVKGKGWGGEREGCCQENGTAKSSSRETQQRVSQLCVPAGVGQWCERVGVSGMRNMKDVTGRIAKRNPAPMKCSRESVVCICWLGWVRKGGGNTEKLCWRRGGGG